MGKIVYLVFHVCGFRGRLAEREYGPMKHAAVSQNPCPPFPLLLQASSGVKHHSSGRGEVVDLGTVREIRVRAPRSVSRQSRPSYTDEDRGFGGVLSERTLASTRCGDIETSRAEKASWVMGHGAKYLYFFRFFCEGLARGGGCQCGDIFVYIYIDYI